ncbi:helix-turn-helix domain-containing protein, partial [Streptomyces sp. NPDC055287]
MPSSLMCARCQISFQPYGISGTSRCRCPHGQGTGAHTHPRHSSTQPCPVEFERAALEGWVRSRSTPQAWALRCRIILACADGASNKDVAAQLGSTPQAVGRWRARFVQYRIAGLGDMPRSGGPRTVTDEQVAAVVTKTLESTP